MRILAFIAGLAVIAAIVVAIQVVTQPNWDTTKPYRGTVVQVEGRGIDLIYRWRVQRDDDKSFYEVQRFNDLPWCVSGARWPDCSEK